MKPLYNPETGEYHTPPSPAFARVLRRKGWIDAEQAAEAKFFVSAAGLDTQEVTETEVGGESPEETPDEEEQ